AALAYTVGLEHPSHSFRTLAPRQVSAEIHEAWRGFFSALARDQTVVALIEDIHWADPSLLSVIDELAVRAQGALLILCPSRPDLTARQPGWGGGRRNFTSVFLEPLKEADAARLMAALLEVADIPDRIRARILDRAEGNPFFLEEVIRQLIDAHRLVRSGDGWRAGADIGDLEIPDTVQEVLAARLDLLPPRDKRVLQLAAVVGRIFWKGPLEQLVDGDAGGLDEALDQLQDRELVQSKMGTSLAGEREYAFKHILTRDVAYGSLPRRERGRAHAAVAEWIERTAGERRLEMIELLAYHYGEAYTAARQTASADAQTLQEKAFDATLAASYDARSKMASARAHHLGSQSLDMATSAWQRAAAYDAMGAAAIDMADGDEAFRCYRAAADSYGEAGADTVEASMALAMACAHVCEPPTRWPGSMRFAASENDVRPYLERGLAAAGKGDSEARVMLLTAKGFWPWSFVNQPGIVGMDEARVAAEEAAQMAHRLDRVDLESAALDALSASYIGETRLAEEISVIDRRLALVDRLDDSREVADIHAMAAWARFDAGAYRVAFEHARRGYELIGDAMPRDALHLLNWQALSLYRLGKWDSFFAVFEQLQSKLGDRRDDPQYFVVNSFSVAAVIHDAQGNAETANRILDLVERLVARDTDTRSNVRWLAEAYALRGDAERAWTLTDAPTGLGGAAVLHAEAACVVAEQSEAWDRGLEVVNKARLLVAREELPSLQGFIARLEGRMASASGDMDNAVTLLRAAHDHFTRVEARWELAHADVHLARALREVRRDDEADALRAGAVKTFEDLGAVRDLERARHLLAT
ncbi:MAG TPA: hypothetical protein VJU79_07490, partial [Candidatus Dormibacteraeota bacterium]|nr:hypothetical protein [Candidatus Dormibacteraeota bacterium]